MSILTFIQNVNRVILNPLVELLFALSTLYFFYGVAKFLSLDVADSSREDAKKAIMWGVVGMLVMFCVYGLVGFVMQSFGIENRDLPDDARQVLKIDR